MIDAMTNPVRPCYACQQFDDHPRHEIADVPESSMHMDCCADVRGCQICATQLQRAREESGANHGRPLGDTLYSLPPMQVEHVPNDDSSDPYNLRTSRLVPLDITEG